MLELVQCATLLSGQSAASPSASEVEPYLRRRVAYGHHGFAEFVFGTAERTGPVANLMWPVERDELAARSSVARFGEHRKTPCSFGTPRLTQCNATRRRKLAKKRRGKRRRSTADRPLPLEHTVKTEQLVIAVRRHPRAYSWPTRDKASRVGADRGEV